MTDSLDIPAGTYRSRLPKVLADLLATGGRTGGQRVDPLAPDLAEDLAREALTLGLRPRGAILAYTVRSLRHGLGVGDLPTPPIELKPGEHSFVEHRIAEALERLKAYRDSPR